MRLLAAVALLSILAGCVSHPSAAPRPSPQPVAAARPTWALVVRVSAETPDGPALPGAEVVAYRLDDAGQVGKAVAAASDGSGLARFRFDEPVRVAVRAVLPGWTREGTVATVRGAQEVVAGPGFTASEGTLYLPLYRSRLASSLSAEVATDTVHPGPGGSVMSPAVTRDLAFPEGTKAAYLARLSGAAVRVRWNDTLTQHADLAAGLAWGGVAWVQGKAAGPGLAPASREASFDGKLPTEGRPVSGDAVLQAAAVTGSAVVGTVPLSFDVTLEFNGKEPPGLPASCHLTVGCLPLPPI